MFQFTREFIINNNEGLLEGGVKFKAADDIVYIDNLINIDKKSIHKVYKTGHQQEKTEVVTWVPTLTNVKVGDVVRVIATLYQDDNVVATFASPIPNTGRTVQYEFIATTQGALVATDSEKPIKDLYATMAVEATKIVIKALDCFTHVGKIEIVKDAVSDSNIGVGAVKVDSIVRKAIVDDTNNTLGTPGLGNTAQILRNMRLQTDANLNPYGLDIDERPIAKGKYDMYTVELVTERRNIGHNVMGSVGASLTTLVFYVLEGEVSDAFGKLFDTDPDTEDAQFDEAETGKEPGILLDEE